MRLLRSRTTGVGLLAAALTLAVVNVAPGATAAGLPAPPMCGQAGGPSANLKLDGWVNTPATYDLAALQALPHTSVTDPFVATAGTKKYTGVALSDLLGFPDGNGIGSVLRPSDPAGPQKPNPQKNDLTRYAVMVTATDCFQALFSAAELSAWALAADEQKPILAWAQGDENAPGEATEALGPSGFARLIIPTDFRGSRRVSNVLEIRVLRPGVQTELHALALLDTQKVPTARLARAGNGLPVSGQTVNFTWPSACSAVTGADGVARCAGKRWVSQSGFTASFAETPDYLPSTDFGPFHKEK